MSDKLNSGFQSVIDETRFQREEFMYAQFSTVNGGLAGFRPKNGGRWVSFNREQLERLATMTGPNQEQAREALSSKLWTS